MYIFGPFLVLLSTVLTHHRMVGLRGFWTGICGIRNIIPHDYSMRGAWEFLSRNRNMRKGKAQLGIDDLAWLGINRCLCLSRIGLRFLTPDMKMGMTWRQLNHYRILGLYETHTKLVYAMIRLKLHDWEEIQ